MTKIHIQQKKENDKIRKNKEKHFFRNKKYRDEYLNENENDNNKKIEQSSSCSLTKKPIKKQQNNNIQDEEKLLNGNGKDEEKVDLTKNDENEAIKDVEKTIEATFLGKKKSFIFKQINLFKIAYSLKILMIRRMVARLEVIRV